ncbi:hypothetical protein FRC07_007263, partial [Ceratobasidium sp. 392]
MSDTILCYFAACADLRASYATPIRQPSELSAIKEVTRAVSSELELLALEEAALRTVRISLAESVNNSAVIALTNRLPPEVLSRIFVLSGTRCVRDVGYQMGGLAGVYDLTKTLLYLSKNTPIHVHVIESGGEGEEEEEIIDAEPEPDEHVCAYKVEGIVTMLDPHLGRAYILDIDSSPASRYGRFLKAILNSWSKRGAVASPEALSIELPSPYQELFVPDGAEYENWESMLLGVSTLHLQDARFDWRSNAYRGLVDLQLRVALAVLKFGGLRVTDGAQNWVQPASIVMGCLQVVNLVNMKPDDSCLILSLITLPDTLAELGITLPHKSTLDDELADFFARSKIATLYCTLVECEYECNGCLYRGDCEG